MRCRLSFLAITILLASELVGTQARLNCPPGTKKNENTCTPCRVGTFQDKPNRSECKTCPDGFISGEGANTCSPCGENETGRYHNDKFVCICDDGFERASNHKCISCAEQGKFYHKNYSSAPELGLCISCAPGTALLQETEKNCALCQPGRTVLTPGRACEVCPVDTYKDSDGIMPCTPCPAGTFSRTRSTSVEKCIKCKTGENIVGYPDVCGICARGEYFTAKYKSCYSCDELNMIQPKPGLVEKCLRCPKGSFANREEMTKCTFCPKGTVYFGKKNCGVCQPGTFHDNELFTCLRCPINTFSDEVNSKRCKRCPKSSYANPRSTECTKCPKQYRLKGRKCRLCPAGTEFNNSTNECDLCNYEYFKPDAGVHMCRKCAEGMRSTDMRTRCF